LAAIGGALLAVISSSGCAIGYSKIAFFTKSNVGIDVDSQPPTVEVSIARREGVIEPAFEGGKTPQVFAGMHAKTGIGDSFLNFFGGVSTAFSGGEAAFNVTNLGDRSREYRPLCLSRGIDNERLPFKSQHIPGPGSVRPFVFGTDTSFGLKVAWSGLTAQVPDTIRFGFQRKEIAVAPLTGQAVTGKTDEAGNPCKFEIDVPSFIATVDVNASVGGGSRSADVGYVQTFATGQAATNLSEIPAIQELIIERADPAAAKALEGTFGPSETQKCIEKWAETQANHDKLSAFLEREGSPMPTTLFIYSKESDRALQEKAVKELEISCDERAEGDEVDPPAPESSVNPEEESAAPADPQPATEEGAEDDGDDQ
jgi:hypothetical protein